MTNLAPARAFLVYLWFTALWGQNTARPIVDGNIAAGHDARRDESCLRPPVRSVFDLRARTEIPGKSGRTGRSNVVPCRCVVLSRRDQRRGESRQRNHSRAKRGGWQRGVVKEGGEGWRGVGDGGKGMMIPSRLCSAAGKSREDVYIYIYISLERSERGTRGGKGGALQEDDKKGGWLVVCLLRLLMAVLGRVRNWRVCTRSLYVHRRSLSFSFYLTVVSSSSFHPYTLFAVALVVPSFFTGRLVPFSVVATFVPPASYVFSSSLTRCVASCRLVLLYRLLLVPSPSVYTQSFASSWIRDSKRRRSRVSLKSPSDDLSTPRGLTMLVFFHSRSNSAISNPAFHTRLL